MGKSSGSPPPPPDYMGAAEAKAAGDLEAAKYATEANRVNQITPYGNLTYSRTPGQQTFDQSAYDAAVAKYNKAISGGGGGVGGNLGGRLAGVLQQQKARKNAVMPNRDDFMKAGSDIWTATQNLSPEQQAQLEANQKLNLGLTNTAQIGLDKAQGLLSDPTVDFSGLPTPISGASAQEEIMKRLQPQLDRQREMMRTQLVNQGIGMGNEAYRGAFDDQDRRENDLLTAAAIRGIDLDTAARQQGISERTYAKDRPLNLINALRTGTQVQNPQFVNPSQQGQTGGADIVGATNALGGYNTDLYNQDVAAANNANSGMYALGGAALSAAAVF